MTEEKLLKKLVEINEQIVKNYNEGKLQQKSWASLGLEAMRLIGSLSLMLEDAKQEPFVDDVANNVKNMIRSTRKIADAEKNRKAN